MITPTPDMERITLDYNPIFSSNISLDDDDLRSLKEGEEIEVDWKESHDYGNAILQIRQQTENRTTFFCIKVVQHTVIGYTFDDPQPHTIVFYPGVLKQALELFSSIGRAEVANMPGLVGGEVRIPLQLNSQDFREEEKESIYNPEILLRGIKRFAEAIPKGWII